MWPALNVLPILIARDKNFDQLGFIYQNLNLYKIFNITGNIATTKKADHILEKPELGEFLVIVSRIIHV